MQEEVSLDVPFDNRYNEYMFDEHFAAQLPQDTQKETIAAIVRFLREGSSCQLVGIPGGGRSTALGLLVYNRKVREKHLQELQQTTHLVLVDFAEIRNRSLFDVMKYLFLNLTESLRERGMKEENIAVGDIFREHLQFQDELVLFQGFKEAIDYMALEKKLSTVFLFSRFEEYVPTVTADFFTNMRILRSRAKYRFSIVFSVTRPLEDTLESGLLADYYEFIAGHTIFMPFADETLSTFWLTHIEKMTGRKMPKTLIKEVLQLTGGHGKLTKLAFESLFAQKDTPKDVRAFLLMQKTITAALKSFWEDFSPAEQADLREEAFSDTAVAQYLEQVGVIQNKKITIPLLSDYIASDAVATAPSSQKIVYDENTNTIHKGLAMLSDQLTASEFRLLRYLIQNEGRVIERDELISVVWEENKSTAGITDQAVDQLIFRLRRKIEEDANHPVHLQTVKGRGFTFSA